MSRSERVSSEVLARRLKKSADEYPRLLAEINDPPAVLLVRGTLTQQPAIGIVGSRDCTEYGRRVAYRLGADLARCGIVVVSGLARGIDSAAHRGALDAGGRSVGVLPCGIDDVYPRENQRLAERLATSGAVVSELEGTASVHRGSFVQRNRIIAGMCSAIVVVEAAHRSGAKITANYALQYNRDVLAVPGPVTSRTSAGANSLINEGAAVCCGIDSVLEQLGPDVRAQAAVGLDADSGAVNATVAGLGRVARTVLGVIPERSARTVEQVVASTSLPVAAVLASLTELEVSGLIRSIGNQRYERR